MLGIFFSKAIRKITSEDVQLIEDACDVLNKVFTKGEIMEEMLQQLRVSERCTKMGRTLSEQR